MKYRKFGTKYVLRIDKGEEIVETLKKFCREFDIKLAAVSGIGATNHATIGLFNTSTKQYHSRQLTGNFEITNLSGNVSSMNGEVYLHLHITLSGSNCSAFGGHLNSAVISGTCEIVIDLIDGVLDRQFDEDVGLNIYKI